MVIKRLTHGPQPSPPRQSSTTNAAVPCSSATQVTTERPAVVTAPLAAVPSGGLPGQSMPSSTSKEGGGVSKFQDLKDG